MRIGITTTIPIEIVYASGNIPVDLNNVFVTDPENHRLIEEAEITGFPRSFCAWVKGIYGVVRRMKDLDMVIAVTQGDCSNTQALMETLQSEGMEVIPFAYPYDRDPQLLRREMDKLMLRLGASRAEVEAVAERIDQVREKVWEIDRRSYQEGTVTGMENHLYQIGCSDLEGDIDSYRIKVDLFLEELDRRRVSSDQSNLERMVRLGYVGVPPIAPEIYDLLEELGARVVFNEVQRQFTLPGGQRDLVERYLAFTYPYSIRERLKDIEAQIRERNIQGIVHYVQSFCFRQVEDILLQRYLDVPVLTVEMDRSNRLDARTRMRIENFVGILKERQR